MTFDWTTFALQTVNFLVLVWLLHRFLYRPMLAAIARRRAAQDEAMAQAAEARRQAEAAQAQWQAERDRLDVDRHTMLAEAEAVAARQAHDMLTAARHEADGILAQGRDALAAERGAVEAEVRREAGRVAITVAARLLRDVAVDVGPEPFLRRLEQHLLEAPEPVSASEPHEAVRLLVAPRLDDGDRLHWQTRFGLLLGGRAVEVVDAPDLIAGARLQIGTTVIDADWAEVLDRAEREMTADEYAS